MTLGNPLSEFWRYNTEGRLPKVTILVPDYQETVLHTNLNDTEGVLIDLLRENPNKVDYWNRLGIKMRRKIEPFVFGNDSLFYYNMEAIEEAASNAVKAIKFKGSYSMMQYIHP